MIVVTWEMILNLLIVVLVILIMVMIFSDEAGSHYNLFISIMLYP